MLICLPPEKATDMLYSWKEQKHKIQINSKAVTVELKSLLVVPSTDLEKSEFYSSWDASLNTSPYF